jgi:hypothetical protein
MESIIRLCLVGVGQNTELTSQSRIREKRGSDLPQQGWVDMDLNPLDCGQSTTMSCSTLLGQGLTLQSQSGSGAHSLNQKHI